MNKILITGAAGFIGFHLTKKLMKDNVIVAIDNINNYYSKSLKYARLNLLGVDSNYNSISENLKFINLDISKSKLIDKLFDYYDFDYVINLAAQAGVRHSINKPLDYIDSNIKGFLNILEASKKYKIKHLIYASSSSVYGGLNTDLFSENLNVDKPISIYAASKKANELMAHTYSSLFKLPTTGLRFFTVYGPWGRPDMAYYKFTENIINGKTIEVYNQGNMYRDFTYIDDIVDGIVKSLDFIPKKEVPYSIYNIGNNKPIKLNYFIELLEKYTNKKAKINYKEIQKGDLIKTNADINLITNEIGYNPKVKIEVGLKNFVEWYKYYYKIK